MSNPMGIPLDATIADASWFEATVSCTAACPVHTNAAGYVQAIGDGRLEDAYDLARAHNPFPSVCGRVCSAPCERACRRGVVDAPVAIRALKRVVSERFGAEQETMSRWHRAHGPVPPATRPSVGIVGAGPAGLAAAYELRLAGHAVTLYERDPQAGGMLLAGIPAFRLPRDVVRAEIAALLSLGIDLVPNCRVGVDRSFAELQAAHAALLITVGCSLGRSLPLPGAELPGVVRAVDGLREVNAGSLGGLEAPVLVIGGGSVAFDAARSARRTAVTPEAQTALDAARVASRATTAPVVLIAAEKTAAMPVPPEELHEAAEEGVIVRGGMGVRRIGGEGRVEYVVVAPIKSLHDELGRFRPTLQDGHDETIPVRTVILAVGQQSDVSFVDEAVAATAPGLLDTPWSGIRAAADGRTAHARVYGAGDVITGPRDLIDAIASGQRVARTICADLSNDIVAPEDVVVESEMRPSRRIDLDRRYWSGYDALSRRVLPVLPTSVRAQNDEVERMLDLSDAQREASRCLHCDSHIMLDAARCVACGLCVDVCPYGCIALVGTVQNDAVSPSAADLFALTLDERACIRCGLCVDRCPANALELASV